MIEPVPLIERLRLAAIRWADENQATLARLGRVVVNDNGYFSRIEANSVTTTATLEKFARFLGDAANWPAGIPEEVKAFVHVTGITTESPAEPTGQCAELSGDFSPQVQS